jgi:hypothetical protein
MQKHPAVAIMALLGAALLFAGFLKHANAMVFSEKPEAVVAGEKPGALIFAPLALLVIAFYISFHIPPFLNALISSAVSHR